jgi:hypothetical protein
VLARPLLQKVRSTAERREQTVNENTPSTYELMALVVQDETDNKAMGVTMKIPMFVEYQDCMWKLNGLKQVTHTSGSISLFATVTRQDEHRLWHIAVIDVTGSLYYVQKTFSEYTLPISP